MMRILICIALCLMLLTFSVMGIALLRDENRDEKREGKIPKELEAFQGEWNSTLVIENGEEDERRHEIHSIVFIHDSITFRDVFKMGKTLKYSVEKSTNPTKIILMAPNGERKVGIYSLENGILKLCFYQRKPTNSDSPPSFESNPGSNISLFVLEKVK